MITSAKVHIYRRYNGDLDAWSHGSRKKERRIMDDNDWYTIENLLQDIKLVESEQASDSYKDEVESKLEVECEDKETIALLIEESKRG